jgi:protocatechuate 3,4-dioxygenase beta subunit
MLLITRRSLISASAAATLVGIASPVKALTPTSDQEMGPFYPVQHLADTDADLTRVQGLSGTAKGTAINVVGRVLDVKGNAVPDARIEIWQANAGGRYRHSGDMNDKAPIDPNFQGYAVLRTDRSGNFKFRTVKPGAYPIGDGRWRTPHIHFDVSGHNERMVTQMYFPGEKLNETDFILATAQSKPTVISRLADSLSGDPNTPAYAWDIVLLNG